MMRKILQTAAAMLLTALTTACSEEGHDRVTIAVSIPPQASLLREIAGDSIDIVTLTDASADPESFEVSVGDMKSVADADAYLSIGHLAFEQALTDRLRQSGVIKTFYDCSRGIEPIYGTHGGDDHDHDHGIDPHTWTSVANTRIIARNMLEALIATDSVNASRYTDNYNRLSARLDSIDSSFRNRLEGRDSLSFLIWHPSLSYFARDYGLDQIAVGTENKEASPASMKSNIDAAAESDIKAFFIQANFDSRQADNLSRELGISPTAINPLDPDWEKQLNIIIDAISRDID